MSGVPPNVNPTTPPQPKPMYPDTPWWATLIAVIVTAFISVIGTVVVVKGGIGEGGFKMPTAASILVDTVTYIPHIMLLFGVLADMFTYDGVWSIPSIVGILSIFGNYVFKYFWIGLDSLIGAGKRTVGANPAAGPAAAAVPKPGGKRGGAAGDYFSNYDGCNVQGFEGFGSRFAPQTLVITATVFSYYIFDLVRNRGWMNSLAALLAGSMLFIAQTFIIGTCALPDAEPGQQIGAIGQALRALAEGVTFGGMSYAAVQTYYPQNLPSSAMSPFPKRSKSDLTPGPDGRLYDADGYPWIVLPNGQTFPDLSTAQSRNAFSAIASMRLGTGRPASQSCPT